jgi:hypothetical protein
MFQREYRLLEKRYAWKEDTSFVDYVAFSNDMEAVFTKTHLELNPTAEPEHFSASLENAHIKHQVIQDSELREVLTKLANKVLC